MLKHFLFFAILYSKLYFGVSDNSVDLSYFTKNCIQKIDHSLNCIQYNWNFPICVPWDTRSCEVTTQKKYCTVYICKVIFLFLIPKLSILKYFFKIQYKYSSKPKLIVCILFSVCQHQHQQLQQPKKLQKQQYQLKKQL